MGFPPECMPPRKTQILFFVLLAGLSLSAPAMLLSDQSWLRFFRPTNGMRTRRAVPDFVLTGSQGQAVHLSDSSGRFRYIFFGFTRCPTVCPRTLGLLRRFVGATSGRAVVLFISVDPTFDTSERLRQFFSRDADRMIPLTGSLDAIARVGRAFEAQVPDLSGTDAMPAAHSSAISVIDPQGNLVLYYPRAPASEETLLADLALLEETNL